MPQDQVNCRSTSVPKMLREDPSGLNALTTTRSRRRLRAGSATSATTPARIIRRSASGTASAFTSRSRLRSWTCAICSRRYCAEFRIPITNFKGWSDLNSRAAMMRRFRYGRKRRGRSGVLLLCGDHDPGGLHITEMMRKNLEDLSDAVDWDPGNLEIIRFGLNADFIDQYGLTWIDNLETSAAGLFDDPEHNDHAKQYVQGYIAQFGARKCEANALVVEPDVGGRLYQRRHP